MCSRAIQGNNGKARFPETANCSFPKRTQLKLSIFLKAIAFSVYEKIVMVKEEEKEEDTDSISSNCQ